MIDILFRECCESCPHIQVDYETHGVGITETATMIGCSHMRVCGMYQQEEPDPTQDITVRGFHDADG